MIILKLTKINKLINFQHLKKEKKKRKEKGRITSFEVGEVKSSNLIQFTCRWNGLRKNVSWGKCWTGTWAFKSQRQHFKGSTISFNSDGMGLNGERGCPLFQFAFMFSILSINDFLEESRFVYFSPLRRKFGIQWKFLDLYLF